MVFTSRTISNSDNQSDLLNLILLDSRIHFNDKLDSKLLKKIEWKVESKQRRLFAVLLCWLSQFQSQYSPRTPFSVSSAGWAAPTVADVGGDAPADSMRWWRGSGGSGDTPCYLRTSYNPILQFTYLNKQITNCYIPCMQIYVYHGTDYIHVRTLNITSGGCLRGLILPRWLLV